MINVHVIGAENIPVFNGHLRKTLISCFSYSSNRYFYGIFKSKEKSTNPQWNIDFNVDLFKLMQLRFFLYGFRSMKRDYYIGTVTINFTQLISNAPENQILNNPDTNIQNVFQIDTAITLDSSLSVIFTYLPSIYNPIRFRPSFYTNSFFHIWCTFSPGHNNYDSPVEIELLQAFSIPNKKYDKKFGYFYKLNKENPWESVGRSSLHRCFLGPTGSTQVHSLSLSKINGKYTFFILNVSDFSGKVSLNFVYEKNGDIAHFADKCFFKAKKNNQTIGLINKIDIDVVPNKKYLVPFYLYLSVNSMKPTKYQFNPFSTDTKMIEFDKPNLMNNSCLDNSENEFYSQIIERTHSITDLENVNFLKTNVLPIKKQVSLTNVLRDYNLNIDSELRFYVGGSTTNTAGFTAYVDYWTHNFIPFNKTSRQISSQITKILDDQLNMQSQEKKPKSYLPEQNNWNSVLSLNLNEIDKEMILVYYVSCDSYLINAFPNGFFLISHCDANNNETLLFRNPIFADSWKSHFATCFQIEFIENEWRITPMRKYFEKLDDIEISLNLAHLDDYSFDDKKKDFSSDEFIDEIKFDDIY